MSTILSFFREQSNNIERYRRRMAGWDDSSDISSSQVRFCPLILRQRIPSAGDVNLSSCYSNALCRWHQRQTRYGFYVFAAAPAPQHHPRTALIAHDVDGPCNAPFLLVPASHTQGVPRWERQSIDPALAISPACETAP